MHIGSKPGQKVLQAKLGSDIFLVLDAQDATLCLYKTVETMLRPSAAALEEYKDQPYYRAPKTGMIYVLSEVSRGNLANVNDEYTVEEVLWELENELEISSE